jgi:dihydrofolate reductase
VTGASVSLDGYIAGPGESGFEHLFAWYAGGDLEFPSTHPEIPFALTAPDHAYMQEFTGRIGVLVVGRHLFDMTNGWDGIHPLDRPVVVVSHSVPDGWVHAHPEIAENKDIAVNGGTIARQCLELGLLDEINFDLVPVLLGGGTPFFDQVSAAPVVLDGPIVIEGSRVTHLRFSVRKT